jgi:hypothetical protein
MKSIKEKYFSFAEEQLYLIIFSYKSILYSIKLDIFNTKPQN